MALKRILKESYRLGTAGMVCLILLGTNGFSQNSVTLNVDGANAVVAQEMFGLLMEVTLGRQWKDNGSIL